MKLQKLILHNFAQHKHKEVVFPANGVCVLQGHNGSGKSNLINALRFVLEGSVPGALSKEHFLTWGEEEGYVELYFEASDTEYRLERALHKSSSKLRWGKESTTSNKEISTKLEELMGISFKLADKFVFVKQGHLNELVNATASERLKLLHKLFNTDWYEIIHTKLGEELQRSQSYEVPAESSAQLHQQLDELNSQYTTLVSAVNSDLALYKAFDAKNVTEQFSYNTHLYNAYHHTTYGYEATKAKIPAQIHIDVAETKLKEYQAIYAKSSALRDSLVPIISDKRTANALRVEHIRNNEEHARLASELEAEKARLQTLKAPIPPSTSGVDPTELKELINETRRKYDNALSFISKFKPTFGTPQCPTCSTFAIVTINNELAPLSSKVAEYEQQRDSLQAQLQEANELWNKWDLEAKAYSKAEALFNTQRTVLERTIEHISQQIANKPKLFSVPASSIEDISELEKQYSQAACTAADATNQIAHYQQSLIHLTSTRTELQKQLQKFEEDYNIIRKYDFGAVQHKIDDYTRLGASINFRQGQILQLESVIREKKVLIGKVQEIEKDLASKRAYSAVLSKARDIFHRENFPTKLARIYFGQVNETWNEMLELFDVPFQAYLSDDLSIRLEFANSSALVEQASGGQQSCVSLAFILAISKLFTSNTGFLVLDEPTYGVDSDHIDRVTDTLQIMDSYAKSNDTLILLVTHEEIIKSRFSQTIEIQAA